MSGKRRPFFNVEKKAGRPKQKETVIGIPMAPEEIRQVVLVVQKQNGSVEVAGPIDSPEVCIPLLKAGMVKIVDWNERKNKSAIEVCQMIPPGLRDVGGTA